MRKVMARRNGNEANERSVLRQERACSEKPSEFVTRFYLPKGNFELVREKSQGRLPSEIHHHTWRVKVFCCRE